MEKTEQNEYKFFLKKESVKSFLDSINSDIFQYDKVEDIYMIFDQKRAHRLHEKDGEFYVKLDKKDFQKYIKEKLAQLSNTKNGKEKLARRTHKEDGKLHVELTEKEFQSVLPKQLPLRVFAKKIGFGEIGPKLFSGKFNGEREMITSIDVEYVQINGKKFFVNISEIKSNEKQPDKKNVKQPAKVEQDECKIFFYADSVKEFVKTIDKEVYAEDIFVAFTKDSVNKTVCKLYQEGDTFYVKVNEKEYSDLSNASAFFYVKKKEQQCVQNNKNRQHSIKNHPTPDIHRSGFVSFIHKQPRNFDSENYSKTNVIDNNHNREKDNTILDEGDTDKKKFKESENKNVINNDIDIDNIDIRRGINIFDTKDYDENINDNNNDIQNENRIEDKNEIIINNNNTSINKINESYNKDSRIEISNNDISGSHPKFTEFNEKHSVKHSKNNYNEISNEKGKLHYENNIFANVGNNIMNNKNKVVIKQENNFNNTHLKNGENFRNDKATPTEIEREFKKREFNNPLLRDSKNFAKEDLTISQIQNMFKK